MGVEKHGNKRRSAASPTYLSWIGMRTRCSNPNEPGWKNYGGRGIIFDPRWDDFAAFLQDMGERPPGTSLERKDNNGNYCKDNCKWATKKEQNNNQRKNVKVGGKSIGDIATEKGELRATVYARWKKYGTVEKQEHPQYRMMTYAGETKNLVDWSRDSRCVVDYPTLQKRVYAGWNFDDALTRRTRTLDLIDGKTVRQWSNDLGVSRYTLYTRLRRHGSIHIDCKDKENAKAE